MSGKNGRRNRVRSGAGGRRHRRRAAASATAAASAKGSTVAAASGVSDGRRLRGLGRAVRTAALPRRCRSGDASSPSAAVASAAASSAASVSEARQRAAIVRRLRRPCCRSADGGRTYRSSECASAGGGGATRAGVPSTPRRGGNPPSAARGGSPPRTATIAASSWSRASRASASCLPRAATSSARDRPRGLRVAAAAVVVRLAVWRRADLLRSACGRRSTTYHSERSRGGGGGWRARRFASFFSLARCACSRAARLAKSAARFSPVAANWRIRASRRERVGKVDLVGLSLRLGRVGALAPRRRQLAPHLDADRIHHRRALDRRLRRGGGAARPPRSRAAGEFLRAAARTRAPTMRAAQRAPPCRGAASRAGATRARRCAVMM